MWYHLKTWLQIEMTAAIYNLISGFSCGTNVPLGLETEQLTIFRTRFCFPGPAFSAIDILACLGHSVPTNRPPVRSSFWFLASDKIMMSFGKQRHVFAWFQANFGWWLFFPLIFPWKNHGHFGSTATRENFLSGAQRHQRAHFEPHGGGGAGQRPLGFWGFDGGFGPQGEPMGGGIWWDIN